MSAVLEPPSLIASRLQPELESFALVTLRFPAGRPSDEEFVALCRENEPLCLEIDGNGDLVIMPPGDTETGFEAMDIGTDVNNWNRRTKSGRVGDSNTGFHLPNGAIRAPDVSWVAKERWESLSPEQRKPFAQIVPDFVVELMSPSDRRSDAQAKMREYIDNGIRLGWLIDPRKKQVEIYEPGKEPLILHEPQSLAGDPVLPGFALNLTGIWE